MRHQEKSRTPNKYNYNRSQSQTVELLSATLKIVANKQINPMCTGGPSGACANHDDS
jgi:hypothetical protein